jgi:hypothetical protein
LPAEVYTAASSPIVTTQRYFRHTRLTDYDDDKIDEVVLALLGFYAFEEDEYGARAWKSCDWDIMDRLHNKGYLSDPKSKAKSVVLTAEGVKRSPELFEQYFALKR